MRKEISTHPEIIKNYDTKTLAFYYVLKSRFSNSTVYNCNKSTIKRRTGISYYLISKYIKLLIESELAYFRDGNLVLISMYKIQDSNYSQGYFEFKPRSFSECVLQLRYSLLKQNILQQEYVLKKKLDITDLQNETTSHSYKYTRKLMKMRDRGDYTEKALNRIVTSSRKVSKLLNVSLGTANAFLKELAQMGWIYIREKVIKMGEEANIYGKPIDVKLGYFYNSNGSMWYSLGSEIRILQ